MAPRSGIAAILAVGACCAVVLLLQAEQGQDDEHLLMQAQRNVGGSIATVSPRKGPFRGGHIVTIEGTNLCSGSINDVARVELKGVPVTKVLSATARRIQVRTASMESIRGLPGSGDVLVVSHSRGVTKARGLYEYKSAPLIFAVSPDNGAHIGGQKITVRGRNLCHHGEKALTVHVCDHAAQKVTCHGNSITAVTGAFNPRHAAGGTCGVRIKSKVYGHSSAPHAFTYRPAPVVLHVTPAEGRYDGGNTIKIAGSDLTSGKGRLSEAVNVKVGGKAATVLDYTPSSVLIKVPKELKRPGYVDIEINSKRHGNVRAHEMYQLNSKPSISQISPSIARANGGEHITIVGRHLGRGDIQSVRVGDHRAHVLYADYSGRKIRIVTPRFDKADEGKVLPITVESSLFGRAKIHGLKVSSRGAITNVYPLAGPASGNTLVTIQGAHLGATKLTDYRKVLVNDAPADIVSAISTQLVVRTRAAPAGSSGAIKIYSRSAGVTESPPAMAYHHQRIPQVTSIHPSQSSRRGGGLVVVQGHRLCNAACDDLDFVQLGNARVSRFVSKTQKRIVFHAPHGDDAGGRGAKTLSVHSKEMGVAESPAGFIYLDDGSAGIVSHADAPLRGGNTIVIEGDNLGVGEQYKVLLAGVEAKVLSASQHKIEIQVGDARGFAKANKLVTSRGLKGDIVIETLSQGVARGMDTQIPFRYNPECEIHSVRTLAGPADGETTLVISGHHLGMGDERIYVDGKPTDSGLTQRRREGHDVHEVAVRSLSAERNPAHVAVKSPRSGRCEWRA